MPSCTARLISPTLRLRISTMRGVSYSKRKPRTAPQHAAMAAAGEGGQRSSSTDRRPKHGGSRDSPAALRQSRCSWRSARALPPLSARPGAALCPAGAAEQGIGEKPLLKSGQALEWAVPGAGGRGGSPSPGVLRNRGSVALRDAGGGHGGGWAWWAYLGDLCCLFQLVIL